MRWRSGRHPSSSNGYTTTSKAMCVLPFALPATVAVCTRDRPDDLSNCLVALSRLRDQGQEILVVDSASRSDQTQQVAAQFPRRAM